MHPDFRIPYSCGRMMLPPVPEDPFSLSPAEYDEMGSFCYSQVFNGYPPEIGMFFDRLLTDFSDMFRLYGFDAYIPGGAFMRCAYSNLYLGFLSELYGEGLITFEWNYDLDDWTFGLTRYGWDMAKRNNEFNCIRCLHRLQEDTRRAS